MFVRLATVFFIFMGCSAPTLKTEETKTDDGAHPNILIIDIDSLRSDRFTIDKDGNTAAPNVMKLASEGVRFSKVVVPAGWTLPSFVTLLAGKTPQSTLLATDETEWHPTAADRLLPSILAAYGYHNGVAWGTTTLSMHNKSKDWFGGESTEDLINIDTYIERMQNSVQEPFFHVIHDMDLHFIQEATDDLKRETQALDPTARLAVYREQAGQRYDQVLKGYDRKIGQLFDVLASTGLKQRTIIVVTSNHGEELADHVPEVSGHVNILFDTVATVPLVISAPSVTMQGRVVDMPVQLQDLAPTLLEMANIPVHEEMTGVSLNGALTSSRWQPHIRDTYTMSFRRAASLRTEHFKLILHPDMCEPEELRPIEALETPVCERLYDLHGDPSEIKNIAKANPALRRSMMRRLMEWINSQVSGEPTKHNDAFRKELQKKGYWQEDTTEKNKQRKEGDQEIIRIDSMSARVTHIVRPTITVPEGTPTDQPVACRVRFVVDVNGVPTKTEVIACHEDHVASVQQIANEWRFEPWTVDGEAIPFVVVKEIRFSLEVESASQ